MDFDIGGYDFRHKDQKYKGRGGVAMFVSKNLNFRVLDDVTTAISNVLECLTTEIHKEKEKNIIISCIYRTPGSNSELFKDWIEDVFSKKSNKMTFICGDFNIDLLNPNKYKMIDKFLNTIYSMNLFPRISSPTRITSHCAILIDNIFTNDIENNTVSGILVSDISDHLPVFAVNNKIYEAIDSNR